MMFRRQDSKPNFLSRVHDKLKQKERRRSLYILPATLLTLVGLMWGGYFVLSQFGSSLLAGVLPVAQDRGFDAQAVVDCSITEPLNDGLTRNAYEAKAFDPKFYFGRTNITTKLVEQNGVKKLVSIRQGRANVAGEGADNIITDSEVVATETSDGYITALNALNSRSPRMEATVNDGTALYTLVQKVNFANNTKQTYLAKYSLDLQQQYLRVVVDTSRALENFNRAFDLVAIPGSEELLLVRQEGVDLVFERYNKNGDSIGTILRTDAYVDHLQGRKVFTGAYTVDNQNLYLVLDNNTDHVRSYRKIALDGTVIASTTKVYVGNSMAGNVGGQSFLPLALRVWDDRVYVVTMGGDTVLNEVNPEMFVGSGAKIEQEFLNSLVLKSVTRNGVDYIPSYVLENIEQGVALYTRGDSFGTQGLDYGAVSFNTTYCPTGLTVSSFDIYDRTDANFQVPLTRIARGQGLAIQALLDVAVVSPAVDTITAKVTSTTDAQGMLVTMTETGAESRIVRGMFTVIEGGVTDTVNKVLAVNSGDVVTVQLVNYINPARQYAYADGMLHFLNASGSALENNTGVDTVRVMLDGYHGANDALVESVAATVRNVRTQWQAPIILKETDVNTNTFTVDLALNNDASGGRVPVQFEAGDLMDVSVRADLSGQFVAQRVYTGSKTLEVFVDGVSIAPGNFTSAVLRIGQSLTVRETTPGAVKELVQLVVTSDTDTQGLTVTLAPISAGSTIFQSTIVPKAGQPEEKGTFPSDLLVREGDVIEVLDPVSHEERHILVGLGERSVDSALYDDKDGLNRFEQSSAQENWGKDVSVVGDVNNDGFDDYVVATQNETGLKYVLYLGSSSYAFLRTPSGNNPLGYTLSVTNPLSDLAQVQWQTLFSQGVSDVNGDGIDDFVVTYGDATKQHVLLVLGRTQWRDLSLPVDAEVNFVGTPTTAGISEGATLLADVQSRLDSVLNADAKAQFFPMELQFHAEGYCDSISEALVDAYPKTNSNNVFSVGTNDFCNRACTFNKGYHTYQEACSKVGFQVKGKFYSYENLFRAVKVADKSKLLVYRYPYTDSRFKTYVGQHDGGLGAGFTVIDHPVYLDLDQGILAIGRDRYVRVFDEQMKDWILLPNIDYYASLSAVKADILKLTTTQNGCAINSSNYQSNPVVTQFENAVNQYESFFPNDTKTRYAKQYDGRLVGLLTSLKAELATAAEANRVNCSAYRKPAYDVTAGDFNRDGLSDVVVMERQLVVSDYKTTVDIAWGNTNMKATYAGVYPLANLATSFLYGDKNMAGYGIGSGGDVNGDGYDDLVFASQSYKTDNKARLFTVFGNARLNTLGKDQDFNVIAGAILKVDDGVSRVLADRLSVTVNGDTNADGYADVVVSIPNDKAQSRRCIAGKCPDALLVMYGRADFDTHYGRSYTLGTFDGFWVTQNVCQPIEQGTSLHPLLETFCAQANAEGASSTLYRGDVNGDGFGDIVKLDGIAKQLSVIFGGHVVGTPNGDLRSLATEADVLLALDSDESSINYTGGLGDMDGDGVLDLLIHGAGQELVIIPVSTNNPPLQGTSVSLYSLPNGASCLGGVSLGAHPEFVPYTTGVQICAQVSDFRSGVGDPLQIDSIEDVSVWSDSHPARQSIRLYETGASSAVFVGQIFPSIIASNPRDHRLLVHMHDCVYVEHNGVQDKICLKLGEDTDVASAASFSVLGENEGDLVGRSMVVADVNGNGQADLLVGAPGAASGNGKLGVFVDRDFTQASTQYLNQADYVVDGTNAFGIQSSLIGDLNGDLVEDVAVASDTNVKIFWGDTRGIGPIWNGSATTLSIAKAQIGGTGDMNGDGFDDTVINGEEKGVSLTFVLFGSKEWDAQKAKTVEVSALPQDKKMRSVYFPGADSVQFVGDVNGDGFDDLALGDRFTDELWILPGASAVSNVTKRTNRVDVPHIVVNARDIVSVGGVGDVTGDGMDDLIVNTNGADARVSLLVGTENIAGWNKKAIDALVSTTFFAPRPFGFAPFGGDVNGDGIADLLVGGSYNEYTRGVIDVVQGGAALTAWGKNVTFDQPINAGQGFSLLGTQPVSFLGYQIAQSAMKDMTGDGIAEILAGSPGFDQFRGRVDLVRDVIVQGSPAIQDLSLFTLPSFEDEAGVINADGANKIQKGMLYVQANGIDPNDQVSNVVRVLVRVSPVKADGNVDFVMSQVGAANACADGIDNDGDGTTDYPSDAGCKNPASISEEGCHQPLKCLQANGVALAAVGIKEKPNAQKGFVMTLVETTPNSGVYRGSFDFAQAGSSFVSQRAGVDLNTVMQVLSLDNSNVFATVYFVPGLPNAPVLEKPVALFDEVNGTHSMQWDWSGNLKGVVDFDVVDGNGNLLGKFGSQVRTWLDRGFGDFGLLPNTLFTRQIKANYPNSSVGSEQQSGYTNINPVHGVAKWGASDTTISVTAQGNFPGLDQKLSGIQFKNVTTGETTNWQGQNLAIFRDLTADTPYSFTARVRNASGIIMNQTVNDGFVTPVVIRTLAQAAGDIKNVVYVQVGNKAPLASNEILAAIVSGDLDSDVDNLPDSVDNCKYDYNPDQLDSDIDGSGDVCDPCPGDATDTLCSLNSRTSVLAPSGQVITDKLFKTLAQRAEESYLLDEVVQKDLILRIDQLIEFIRGKFICNADQACPTGYSCVANICQQSEPVGQGVERALLDMAQVADPEEDFLRQQQEQFFGENPDGNKIVIIPAPALGGLRERISPPDFKTVIYEQAPGLVDVEKTSQAYYEQERAYVDEETSRIRSDEQLTEEQQQILIQQVITESARRINEFDGKLKVQFNEAINFARAKQVELAQKRVADDAAAQKAVDQARDQLFAARRLQVNQQLGNVKGVRIGTTTLEDVIFNLRSLRELVADGDVNKVRSAIQALQEIISITGLANDPAFSSIQGRINSLNQAKAELESTKSSKSVIDKAPNILVNNLDAGGAKVDLPNGWSASDKTVSITSYDVKSKPQNIKLDASEGKVLTPGSNIFEFNTSTPTFGNNEASITIKLDDATIKKIQEGKIDVNNLKIHRYNEATQRWESLPTVYDPVTQTMTVKTTHFSFYTIGEETTPPPAPVANFVGSPLSGPAPLNVNFTDTSIGSVDSYFWSFGDSQTNNAQNPSHTYTSSGTYTVTLTVIGPGGSDQEVKAGYVHVGPAVPAACVQNSDCPVNKVCQAGNCVTPPPAPECTVNSDCPAPKVCQAQQCVTPPECTVNADCPGGQVCQAQHCVVPPPVPGCVSDAQCPVGQSCQNGNCVAAPVVPPPQQPQQPQPPAAEQPQEPSPVAPAPQEPVAPLATVQETVNSVADAVASSLDIAVVKPISEALTAVNALIAPVTDNPVVEGSARVSVPVVVTVSVINAVGLFGFVNGLLVMQSSLIQPLLFIFRRRKAKWGIVYDAYTKLPVDLAIVRLVDAQTNRLVQTRITDLEGRYQFVAPKPGKYLIRVQKEEYGFPAESVSGMKMDGKYDDLYHGEAIEVSAGNAVITLNIPLDTQKQVKPVASIVFRNTMRRVQNYTASIVFGLSAALLVIIPSWWYLGLFVFNVVFYGLMKRFVYQVKPKGYAVVADHTTLKPLSNVMMKIFDAQYDKMLDVQVTDSAGRYGFLVGKNTYYVTAEKENYEKFRSEPLRIAEDKESGVIATNISLNKGMTTPKAMPQAPQTPPSQPRTPPPSAPSSGATVGSNVDTMSTQNMQKMKQEAESEVEDIDLV